MEHIQDYLNIVSERYKTGLSGEHSYRGHLQILLGELLPGILVTNEPARIDCGAPDYILTRKNIPVGYIEAKDLGNDLDNKAYKEQLDRYRQSLPNLIITNYLTFRFYRDGEKVAEVSISEVDGNKINFLPENFKNFHDLITDFVAFTGQTITSSKNLAKMMAGKARLMANVLGEALTADENTEANTSLQQQLKAFREILIHDITPKDFADIYAQTIAYGMFAARLHDPTLEDFSRQEAAELIPKTNPFLRKLFQYIAGYDLDQRIDWIVDALADIFRATDVASLMKNFGKTTQRNDPFLHFYETFLAEYDPKLRKSRGVWYTPEPVVNFIVRAVDDILKTEFGIKDGLADTSQTTIKIKTDKKDARTKNGYTELEKQVHKVQILDPATGTGTFLAEIIKHIHQKFAGQQGAWNSYVQDHLIPRLNGFELLMAPYAMAHLKLEMLLNLSGYKPEKGKEQRLRVFLTNSLEEHHPDTGTLFATWLAQEASEANHVKRDTPVMVVLGNPPYAVSSSNASIDEKGKKTWIGVLLDDYKKDLNEKKLNLDDDYIKFIRYGQYLIDKNGEGILAYISNNSFISGVTHRQMRYELSRLFNRIYIINLHGNSKQKEVCPDGSKDENVFDITQGVSINIFIKSNKNIDYAKIFHADVYGLRNVKYDYLWDQSISKINWENIKYNKPYYFFRPSTNSILGYENGFKLNDLIKHYNTGIQTKKDDITIQFNHTDIIDLVSNFKNLSIEELGKIYKSTSGTWKLNKAKDDLLSNDYEICQIAFKPFDNRFTALTKKSSGFLGRPRYETMRHMLGNKNHALLVGRQNKSPTIDSFFITDKISEMKCAERTIQSYHFPLYILSSVNKVPDMFPVSLNRKPNLDQNIVNQIAKKLSLCFLLEKENKKGTFAPIDLLDYIYAVLHSPKYRDTYKEFLKIDFPRVPYPEDANIFCKLVALGGELRQLHLLESPKVEQFITTYPVDGDNKVTRSIGKNDYKITNHKKNNGQVWINDTQYFDGVPKLAWEFYIGGYQPAQKWLKDRKGRTLDHNDIFHYQKIIVALTETDRIMKGIDHINWMK